MTEPDSAMFTYTIILCIVAFYLCLLAKCSNDCVRRGGVPGMNGYGQLTCEVP